MKDHITFKELKEELSKEFVSNADADMRFQSRHNPEVHMLARRIDELEGKVERLFQDKWNITKQH